MVLLSGLTLLLFAVIAVWSSEGEDAVPVEPTNFYCTLENNLWLACSFNSAAKHEWAVMYSTDSLSNAESGAANVACNDFLCTGIVTQQPQLYTTYNFTVFPVDTDPLTQPSYSFSIYTNDSIIKLLAPENLAVRAQEEGVEVTWDAPVNAFGVLDHVLRQLVVDGAGLNHEVTYHPVNSGQVHKKTKMFFSHTVEGNLVVLNDMLPFTTYTIRIRSRVSGSPHDYAWSHPAFTTVLTSEGVPTVAPSIFDDSFHVSDRGCSADNYRTITIYWKGIIEVSGQSNGVITGYFLSSSDGLGVTVDGAARHVTLNLIEDKTYTLNLRGITKMGTGNASASIEVPSQHEMPMMDSCLLSVVQLNGRVAALSWTAEEIIGTLYTYTVYWCIIDQEECKDIEAVRPANHLWTMNVTLDSPFKYYRFGLAVKANNTSSGIVWSACAGTISGQTKDAIRHHWLAREDEAGLSVWSLTGIVAGASILCSFLVIFICWYVKAGKDIKNIPHIPRSNSANQEDGLQTKYQYDAISKEYESYTHIPYSEKCQASVPSLNKFLPGAECPAANYDEEGHPLCNNVESEVDHKHHPVCETMTASRTITGMDKSTIGEGLPNYVRQHDDGTASSNLSLVCTCTYPASEEQRQSCCGITTVETNSNQKASSSNNGDSRVAHCRQSGSCGTNKAHKPHELQTRVTPKIELDSKTTERDLCSQSSLGYVTVALAQDTRVQL